MTVAEFAIEAGFDTINLFRVGGLIFIMGVEYQFIRPFNTNDDNNKTTAATGWRAQTPSGCCGLFVIIVGDVGAEYRFIRPFSDNSKDKKKKKKKKEEEEEEKKEKEKKEEKKKTKLNKHQ